MSIFSVTGSALHGRPRGGRYDRRAGDQRCDHLPPGWRQTARPPATPAWTFARAAVRPRPTAPPRTTVARCPPPCSLFIRGGGDGRPCSGVCGRCGASALAAALLPPRPQPAARHLRTDGRRPGFGAAGTDGRTTRARKGGLADTGRHGRGRGRTDAHAAAAAATHWRRAQAGHTTLCGGNDLAARRGGNYKGAAGSCPPPTASVGSAHLFSRTRPTRPVTTSSPTARGSTRSSSSVLLPPARASRGDTSWCHQRDHAARSLQGHAKFKTADSQRRPPRGSTTEKARSWTAHAVVICTCTAYLYCWFRRTGLPVSR